MEFNVYTGLYLERSDEGSHSKEKSRRRVVKEKRRLYKIIF